MILDGVDVFVRVVQAGGFSAAARLMGMPTTTVSAKIKKLEQRLGTTLIRRSTRRMSVTDAGRAYYDHCVQAIDLLKDGEDQLAAGTTEPTGVLRLTAPPDLSQLVLPQRVLLFLERYPKVEVEMVVTNQPLDPLAHGIDLAIRASPMKDSALTSRRFATGQLGLWASPDYLDRHKPIKQPADLARHPVLVLPSVPASYLKLENRDGSRYDLKASARVKADDMQTIRALVAHGAGIGLLPLIGDDGDLVRVLPAYATAASTVYFVYPAQRFLPSRVRAFMDLAVSD